MDDVKLTLNIRHPPTNSDALTKAATKKKASIETIEDAWIRIFAMKNTEPVVKKLHTVKRAMEAGKVGRIKPSGRFSKSEALEIWRVLDAEIQAQRLRDMVDNMPDNYELITTKPAFERFIKLLESEEEIVFDVETTGTDVWEDHIVGHVISAVKANIHAYIPTKHDEGDQLPHEYVSEGLRPIYEDASVGKIAHNAKFDMHMLDRDGITLRGLTWDTMEAMKLLNENEMSYALKPLVTKYLDDQSSTYGQLFGNCGFNEIGLEEAVAYAAKDGDVTLRLRDFQRKHMQMMPEVFEYFTTVEMPLVPIIVETEKEGYIIDLDFAGSYGKELTQQVEVLSERVFGGLGDINLNSPAQLKPAIESYIGRTIENTNADYTLKPLAKEYPIIQDLLDYRELSKLLSTYVDALPTLIKKKTGRVHAGIYQNGARTGRFSSGSDKTEGSVSKDGLINVQNQPPEARGMFVAPTGYYIVGADFSAQEVRLIASQSKEQILLDAFAAGRDAYATLASEFFNKPYEECFKNPDGSDTEERKQMKVVLLQSIYGASKYGIATSLEITPDEAEKFRLAFFKKYRKIDAFIKETQAFANKHGFVWIGDKARKRRLPEAKGYIRRYDPKRNRAMRQGPNARIQGLAAIQTKITLVELDKVAKERGWKHFGAIHDEILVLMPDTAAEKDFRILNEVMTQSFLIDGVENKTDIEIQRRWSDSITLDEFLSGKEVPKL